MGQDSTCGICSKHYQECSHYIKTHIKFPFSDVALCGKQDSLSLVEASIDDYEYCDIDPEDWCKTCDKRASKFGYIRNDKREGPHEQS